MIYGVIFVSRKNWSVWNPSSVSQMIRGQLHFQLGEIKQSVFCKLNCLHLSFQFSFLLLPKSNNFYKFIELCLSVVTNFSENFAILWCLELKLLLIFSHFDPFQS